MGFLKPKTTTTPTSINTEKDYLKGEYAPTVAVGNKSTNFIGDLLGVNSGGSATDAFERYKSMAGYAPALEAMQKGVTGGAAAKGLLNSGSTQKALVKYGAGLDQQTFGNFLQQLAGLSGLGLQGGQMIGNAGQQGSTVSTSPSTAGQIASGIGGVLSIFSDRRLKRDITLLDVLPDGLGVYAFRMFDEAITRIGVMADEVAKFRPWALGPEVGGFATVKYGQFSLLVRGGPQCLPQARCSHCPMPSSPLAVSTPLLWGTELVPGERVQRTNGRAFAPAE